MDANGNISTTLVGAHGVQAASVSGVGVITQITNLPGTTDSGATGIVNGRVLGGNDGFAVASIGSVFEKLPAPGSAKLLAGTQVGNTLYGVGWKRYGDFGNAEWPDALCNW